MLRQCKSCGEEKNLELFVLNYKCKFNRIHRCKKCHFSKHKEKSYKIKNAWRKANKEKVYAENALRRAKKLKATPAWVDKEGLKKVYMDCPEGYEVDHIVPLNSNLVCGLHVPWNLQYLTREENLRKNNKFNVV